MNLNEQIGHPRLARSAAILVGVAALGAAALLAGARQEQPADPEEQPQPAPETNQEQTQPVPEEQPEEQGEGGAPGAGEEPQATEPGAAAEPARGAEPEPEAMEAPALSEERDELGRRITNGQTTTLAFKNVTLERVIPFIVESTGKVVLPQQDVLTRRITIINDKPLPQRQALDLVFLALQQNGIAVVETPELITLRDIAEIVKQDVPVIGPETRVASRTDYGTIAEKVFRLNNADAANIGEILDDSDALPDYAKITVDEDSNQVVVLGNIALLQRMERLVEALDAPNAAALSTETFRLRYADAEQIAQNIKDLYEENRNQAQQGNQQRNPFAAFMGGPQGGAQQGGRQRGNQQGGGGGGPQGQQGQGGATGGSTSENLRVTANKQQNSVTVLAEPQVLDQIRELINGMWDRPLPDEAVLPKIYDLKNSDPIKVRDLLEGLFGSATTSSQGGTQSSQGVGRLAGQFSFEAIPEAGRLVVVAKSPDNLFVIDQIIEGLDQPQTAGLPEVIELKHANSEDLAEQINSLLALEGTLAQVTRSESGLSDTTSSASPFAQDADESQEGDSGDQPQQISFWWQRSRPPTDNRGASNLVGKIRVVPVWRQNAVMVLAPPEYRSAIIEMISQIDKPGRQVLISAIVAEISGEDATALGLRWSNSTIIPTNPDNAVSVGTTTTAQENDFLGNLFDTSVLDVNADLNVLLQLLNEKSTVNILSEPRIFTSDNQEAEFFDGQDIPFVTESQTTDQGGLTQSTDYRAVGIQLRVRPRITVNRDVDLRVNLELSSIQPGQTINNQFIVDRRETTTQLIVKDGQTIVISGILRSEESEVKRKVPLLGDIPLIGALFTSMEKSIVNTELVAFITPLVVDNETRMNEVNQPYRTRLGTLRQELGSELQNTLGPDTNTAGGAVEVGLDEGSEAGAPESGAPPAEAPAAPDQNPAAAPRRDEGLPGVGA